MERLPFDTIDKLTRTYLIVVGVLYSCIGLTWIILPAGATRTAGVEWLHGIEPWMIGVAWIVVGCIAVLGRFHSGLTNTGFQALIATPTLLASWFLISWLFWVFSDGAIGAQRGIATTVSYATFAVAAYVVARVHVLSRRHQ